MIALVLGGADCVWRDLIEARRCVGDEPWVIVATNNAGVQYPGEVAHWASFHVELFPKWIAERSALGYAAAACYWSVRRNLRHPIPNVPEHRTVDPWGGSSGLIAAQVGMMVADKVILCGVPMDTRPHFVRGTEWREALTHQRAWERHRLELLGRVKSMSGWTAQLLGLPTKEWVDAKCLVKDDVRNRLREPQPGGNPWVI